MGLFDTLKSYLIKNMDTNKDSHFAPVRLPTSNVENPIAVASMEQQNLGMAEVSGQAILKGKITLLDLDGNPPVGIISNLYRFHPQDVMQKMQLKEGTRVTFHAQQSAESAILIAKEIKPVLNETNVSETNIVARKECSSINYEVLKIFYDRIIAGVVSESESGVHLESSYSIVEVKKEHLPKECPVVVGDWLYISFGEGGDRGAKQVRKVEFEKNMSRGGRVKRNQNGSCLRRTMVSSSSEEAENQIKEEEESTSVQEEAIRELLQDKSKIRIQPKRIISFETKLLGTTSSKLVTVENFGDHRVLLRGIRVGGIQDVAKFDLDFGSKALQPEDLLVEFQPHRTWNFTLKCTPRQFGRTKELIVFDFGSFQIGRWLYVHSAAAGHEEMHKSREGTCAETWRKRKDESLYNLMRERSVNVITAPGLVRVPFFTPNKILKYEVPEDVLKCFEMQNQNPNLATSKLLAMYPAVGEELNDRNYVEQFKVSLWFEEIEHKRRRREYDVKLVELKRGVDGCHIIPIKTLQDFHPPLLTGDFVVVEDTLSSGATFRGPIVKINYVEDDGPCLHVRFHNRFALSYDGGRRNVHFELGRTSYRRMHFAVEQAVNHLGPEWLFPTNIVLTEPRIHYVEDDEDNLHPAVHTNVSGDKSYDGTSRVRSSPHDEDRRLRTLKPFEGNVSEPCYLDSVKLKWYNHDLNDEQKDAVRRILKGQGRPLPYIIFGPPGTGKSITVVEAIMQVYFLEPTSRILVTAPSNSATDLLANLLKKTNRFKPGDFVRLNGFIRAKTMIPNGIADFCEDGENLDEIAKSRLIISTVATAGQFFALSIKTGHFSHVFIDEAGYCTEPETMIPCVMAAVDKQSQIILVGDPEQLGPVLMCNITFNEVLERSFLARLMSTKIYERDEDAFPETKYNPAVVTKLVRSYRAHQFLLKLPSQLFYSDELVSCVQKRDILDLCENLPFLPKKGIPLVFHGVDGDCHPEEDYPGWFNLDEAAQVMEYVKLLRRNGVSSEDIGIITPYRKQVEKIRKVLKTGWSEDGLPKIASVQEFQGGERKVIIISTVRSYSEDIVAKKVPHLDFLYSKRRFNVAITRAQALLIVIGNTSVLAMNTYWRRLLQYSIDSGVYTGCPLPKLIGPRWVHVTSKVALAHNQSQVPDLLSGTETSSVYEDEEEYSCSTEEDTSRF